MKCNLLKYTILTAGAVGFVLALSSIGGCTKAEKDPQVVRVEAAASAVAAAPPEPVEKPTVAQQLDAMVRPYERMVTVCADGLRDQSFFLLFRHTTEENKLIGWYHVESIEFYKTSNNTWFIGDIPDNKFFKAYPDITGLQCKDKNVTTP